LTLLDNVKEFSSWLAGMEPQIVEKAFSLANGMISVYGYTKEKAIAKP